MLCLDSFVSDYFYEYIHSPSLDLLLQSYPELAVDGALAETYDIWSPTLQRTKTVTYKRDQLDIFNINNIRVKCGV